MLPAITRWGLGLALVLQIAHAHAAPDTVHADNVHADNAHADNARADNAHAHNARPDIKLPPGTRSDASGQLVSSRGLRDTTDFLAKELDRRGIAVTKIGPVRVRGVELVRFLSQTPSTPWLAIHVLRSSGKTAIFFVPRSPSPRPS